MWNWKQFLNLLKLQLFLKTTFETSIVTKKFQFFYSFNNQSWPFYFWKNVNCLFYNDKMFSYNPRFQQSLFIARVKLLQQTIVRAAFSCLAPPLSQLSTNQKDVATIFCTNVHTMVVIEELDNADSFPVFSVPRICIGITVCVK